MNGFALLYYAVMQRSYAVTWCSALNESQPVGFWLYPLSIVSIVSVLLFPLFPLFLRSSLLPLYVDTKLSFFFYLLVVSLRGILMWVFGSSCDRVRFSLFDYNAWRRIGNPKSLFLLCLVLRYMVS